jgi:ankyrin repeat protein
MDALLKAGADINATDNAKQTALIVAMRSGSIQSVAELLRRGARTDIVDDEGNTARDYARRQGHTPEVLKMLSKHSPPRR